MAPPAPAVATPDRGQLHLLTGPVAGEILQAAMQDHGEVLSWRPNQVDHQPGRGSTAAYRVRVRWPDGRVTDERFAAYTGDPPAGALVVGDGVDQVAVWRVPRDPYLPGLSAAHDPVAVGRLMADLGVARGPVSLRLRAYRPRRRAVVEAVGPGGRLFLKVVRPGAVESIHQRHRLLSTAGVPVAPSLGYTPEGLLVLPELPGASLRRELRRPSPAAPSATAILALLDRLPGELVDAPRRRSWLERVEHYAAVVAGALPGEAGRATGLAAAIVAGAGTGPTVPVHGDLYDNQLWVRHGRISGLLDLDTAGPGDRIDDLACLLGHLSVLTLVEPARAGVINRLGSRYLGTFGRSVDPVDLRYRVAAVVLSLATGPHRVQDSGWQRATRQRLDLAEQWLDGARARAGRADMRRLSDGSNRGLMVTVKAGGRGPANAVRPTDKGGATHAHQ